MTVWLTVPCHRPRLDWLRECVVSTGVPRERVVVVTNGPDPILRHEVDNLCATLLTDSTPGGPNISRWWNMGMDAIHGQAKGEYEILVSNADVIWKPQTVERMAQRLRKYGVAAVAPDQAKKLLPGTARISHDPRDYSHGMHMWGYCYMLAGEKRLRADEDIRWWLSDNILEVYAKQNGGFALLGGLRCNHRSQTPWEEPWISMGDEDREKMDQKLWDLDYFHRRG